MVTDDNLSTLHLTGSVWQLLACRQQREYLNSFIFGKKFGGLCFLFVFIYTCYESFLIAAKLLSVTMVVGFTGREGRERRSVWKVTGMERGRNKSNLSFRFFFPAKICYSSMKGLQDEKK